MSGVDANIGTPAVLCSVTDDGDMHRLADETVLSSSSGDVSSVGKERGEVSVCLAEWAVDLSNDL